MTADDGATLLAAPTLDGANLYYATHSADECEELARELLASPEEDARAVGLRLLSRAATHETSLHAALDEAAVVAARDSSATVRSAAAFAAGEVPFARAVDVLVSLVRDADAGVRAAAAESLPLSTDAATPSDRVVGALLLLLHDGAPVVRDVAAFGIGTQLSAADSPRIRSALTALLDEPDSDEAYPAAEAAMGLALRGDISVAAVIADRLRRGNAGQLWVEAAGALGNPLLLDALREQQAPGDDPADPWVEALGHAIASCSGGADSSS